MNDHELRVYESILGLLPSADNPTPLVRLNSVVSFQHTRVFAKLEWYNPFGSVKDRIAANLVHDAEERGTLGPGRKLVEPTSGNTGLGLAMIANAKGYTLRAPLSRAIPQEKRTALRFFGCDVVELDDSLCPAPGAPEGAIACAMDTARDDPRFHMLNQYENEANPDAHARTTGPEIWRQTEGRVTHFVAGLGTCGTITGTGAFLKARNADVQVIGIHPEEGHDIPGVRSLRQLKQTKLYRPEQYDAHAEVTNREAFEMCRRLHVEESLIAGPSSGMALVGALRAVPDRPGAIAVVMFPDNVFKYASSLQRHFPELCPTSDATDGRPSRADSLLALLKANSRNPHDTIEPRELQERLQRREDPLVVDVRAPGEYAQVRVPRSVNAPLAALESGHGSLPDDRDAPIVTVCNVGQNSITALLVLKSLGYRNVRNLRGGLVAWVEEGFALDRG